MNTKLESETYVLPAYWASYLINGDASGIDEADVKKADAFLTQYKLAAPVSCSDEAYFSRSNDAARRSQPVERSPRFAVLTNTNN